MNEIFKVDSIAEITKEHFTMACVAAMAQEEELKGMLGVPCGDDFLLYSGPGKSIVEVRNWSHMLSLHVVSKSGKWIVSSHIEGMGAEGVIEEAWRQFESARPYIKTEARRAFTHMVLAEGACARWLEGQEDMMKKIKEYVHAYTKD